MVSHNTSSFYFQSSRRGGRGRSGEPDEGRQRDVSTTALMGRIAALDQQLGAVLRGEGRAPHELTEPLTALHAELGGLAVALKELAHLREGQEGAQRENEALRAEVEGLRAEVARLSAAQEGIQAAASRIAIQVERLGRGPVGPLLITTTEPAPIVAPKEPEVPAVEAAEAPTDDAAITIEPVRPRLVLGEWDPEGTESVVKLDEE